VLKQLYYLHCFDERIIQRARGLVLSNKHACRVCRTGCTYSQVPFACYCERQAEQDILDLMDRDSFARFKQSDLFQEFLNDINKDLCDRTVETSVI